MTAPADQRLIAQRWRVRVRGIVQGVGFRPFVYRLAQTCGVAGFVGNDSEGVFIEIEGAPEVLTQFAQRLRAEAPPLAHITDVAQSLLPWRGETGFAIVESVAQTQAHTFVSPDVAVCEDCLRELFDPSDRRFGYPFINCTNCGPRFTIIKDVPYDRPLTTMARFKLCAACQSEYDDPANRRFHAQPNACADCGPHLSFLHLQHGALTAERVAALAQAQAQLIAGSIVAIKGIGGFHLACDACNDEALARLRERKGRVDKPFAVMVRDLEAAERLVEINDAERALLTSAARPIVLLKKRAGLALSMLVAPGNNYLGVMLPYAPLHHLLFATHEQMPLALVMTSGNYSDEPIAITNEEALSRLVSLADAFLLHDRDIHVPCDDSVMRVCDGHTLPIRRSRGYAPFPVRLPMALPATFATGGEIKNAFCLVKDDCAILSQHIGDMENLETLAAFENSLSQMKALFRVEPQIVATDAHPGYLSAQWNKQHLSRLAPRATALVTVQHHHAHLAAVLAENQWLPSAGPAIGFSFDGTGYGEDGAIWGGEILLGDYQSCRRAGHLRYFPLPGGDAAIKRPYRVALAYLWAAGIEWNEALPPVQACPLVERKVLRQQCERSLNTVPTSSMGRLFDAVAALAGIRQTVTYEAQAAIEMEALSESRCNEAANDAYRFALLDSSEEDNSPWQPWQLDAIPLLRAVVADVLADVQPARIAARFTQAVADIIVECSLRLRESCGSHEVALTGGVFQNVSLLQCAQAALQAQGFTVFTHRRVPPNDGGLALGQAMVAGARALAKQRG